MTMTTTTTASYAPPKPVPRVRLFLALFLSTCLALFHEYATLRNNNHGRIRNPKRRRRVLQGNNATQLGSVTMDWYRTFETNTFFIWSWRSHSIPSWRVNTFMNDINRWYDERIDFQLGNVYSLDAPQIYRVQGNCFTRAREFANGPDVVSDERIAVVVAADMQSSLISCHSGLDQPVGEGVGPTAIISSNFQSWLGGSFAHGVGHLLGLDHTSEDRTEGLMSYTQCGLDLKYPFFEIVNLLNAQFTQDGVTYSITEWPGRTNIMSRFQLITLFSGTVTGEIGVFREGYDSIFTQIVECWMSRSNANLARRQRERELNGEQQQKQEEEEEVQVRPLSDKVFLN